MKSTTAIVEQIHGEFEKASKDHLSEAKRILSMGGHEKAKRLIAAGFLKANEAAAYMKLDVASASLVEKYQTAYPNNKFITRASVLKICEKYNLVCAPITQYKGFVPENNLRQLEKLSVRKEDKPVDTVVIKGAWNTGASGDYTFRRRGAKRIHERFQLAEIPVDNRDLMWHGNKLFSAFGGYIEKYSVTDNTSLLICAPKKEMDLTGLKKI